MKKRKSIVLLVVALSILSLTVGAFAKSAIQKINAELRTDFVVKIDGEVQEFKNVKGERVYPILYNGTTYLPVRTVGELTGKTVYWYEDDKRVELRKPTVTDADVIIAGEKKEANSNADRSAFIGEDKAKAIALEKAGFSSSEVRFDRVELDEDEGVWHYEVEFVTGSVEYEVDIGAVNGAILKWEKDVERHEEKAPQPAPQPQPAEAPAISAEKAKAIALQKAGLSADDVVFEKTELDRDDGILKYEVEFKYGRTEYSAEINAQNGQIVDWEADLDD